MWRIIIIIKSLFVATLALRKKNCLDKKNIKAKNPLIRING